MDAGATVPTQPFAQLKGHVKMKVTPPKIATRNTRGPFLLKCHRVVYDEESNRLKLAEFVGHEVHRDINEDDEEEEEYEDTVMASEESDLAGTVFRGSGIWLTLVFRRYYLKYLLNNLSIPFDSSPQVFGRFIFAKCSNGFGNIGSTRYLFGNHQRSS